MLYLDEDNIVRIRPEAKQMEEVAELISYDKTKNKSFVQKVITFIYHSYSKDHTFAFLSEASRIKRVMGIYLPGEDLEEIIKPKCVKTLIKAYKETTYNPAELFIESIKKDMDELIFSIREMPMTISQKIEKVIKVTVVEEGRPKEIEVPIKTTIDLDNSKEKVEAFKRADQLLDMFDKWNERAKRERRAKKKEENSYKFDHRD